MNAGPARISLDEWRDRYRRLVQRGLEQPWYGGPLERHLENGNRRLASLRFDNSPAALRLWNLLLTEEDRLHAARSDGKKIVGAMKDLGTVPILAYAAPELVAFYPDGAWWTPCVMEGSDGSLEVADAMGIDDSFCPVRAILGAFETERHFPIPDVLTCSVGGTCDDFSAIAQQLEHLGYPILWWEIPRRRIPDPGETAVQLPGGWRAPAAQVRLVVNEFARIRAAFEELAGHAITDDNLRSSIRSANVIRRRLQELRDAVYRCPLAPLPALEMLIAEVLPLHFCSDRSEAEAVLRDLVLEVHRRIRHGDGVLPPDAARIFWVNPVADLRAMNLLEDCGGRICGTDLMISHAHTEIPEDLPPLHALANIALADPMIGTCGERAGWICTEAARFGAEAIVISRIPGASHCALEGDLIRHTIHRRCPTIPVLEIEVPSVSDALSPTLRTRLEALVECVTERRARVCSVPE